jgi:hypothetical protein
LGYIKAYIWCTSLNLSFYILFKDIYRYLEGKGAKFHNYRIGNGGTQELGGIILTISRLDDEIKEWEKARLPEGMYPSFK